MPTNPFDNNAVAAKKPLKCGFCGAERWNDETVAWLPLRGDHRTPYCANTCARWVMTGKQDFPNEVVLPELFRYTAELEGKVDAARATFTTITHQAADGSMVLRAH